MTSAWHLQNINKIYEAALALLAGSAAKPDPVFSVQPNFGPNFWVQMGQVDLKKGSNLGSIL